MQRGGARASGRGGPVPRRLSERRWRLVGMVGPFVVRGVGIEVGRENQGAPLRLRLWMLLRRLSRIHGTRGGSIKHALRRCMRSSSSSGGKVVRTAATLLLRADGERHHCMDGRKPHIRDRRRARSRPGGRVELKRLGAGLAQQALRVTHLDEEARGPGMLALGCVSFCARSARCRDDCALGRADWLPSLPARKGPGGANRAEGPARKGGLVVCGRSGRPCGNGVPAPEVHGLGVEPLLGRALALPPLATGIPRPCSCSCPCRCCCC
jgi:hypothetical protein